MNDDTRPVAIGNTRLFEAEQARMRELTDCYKGAGHQQNFPMDDRATLRISWQPGRATAISPR